MGPQGPNQETVSGSLLSDGTDRQYGRKLETHLRLIDVPVLSGKTLTYNCSPKTLSPYSTLKGKALVALNYTTVTVTLIKSR